MLLFFLAAAVSLVDSAARAQHFRGVVRVERAGKVLVDKGYGEPADTTFWVASISKSFTAALVLRLREQGKLRLEDRVGDVTVDELLTHTSGLPRAAYAAEGIADIDAAQRTVLALPRGPKGKFAYSNDGYSLLAIVAERKGGAPFFELLQREILDRAGLRHTGFWPRCFPGARVARLTRPPQGDRARENWGFKGAEGICTTAQDLSRFVHALAGGRLLSPSSVDLLWQQTVKLSEGFAGRGFFVDGPTIWTRGTEDYGHNGVVKWLPSEQLLIVVLSDVPEPKADRPAPSRALGDVLEARRAELR